MKIILKMNTNQFKHLNPMKIIIYLSEHHREVSDIVFTADSPPRVGDYLTIQLSDKDYNLLHLENNSIIVGSLSWFIKDNNLECITVFVKIE